MKWSFHHVKDNFLAFPCQQHVCLDKLLLDHEKYRSCKNTLYYLSAHSLVKAGQSFIADHFNDRIKSTCAAKISVTGIP